MITLPLVLTLPIVGGILAVASTETHSRRERFWLRAGSSAVGALSGISLYKLFPAGTGLMVIGALAGGSFGVVVGYRLAWVP
jgi:hypothetical protein